MSSAVSADGAHLSRASRAAATSVAAAFGSFSIRDRRAVSACRQATQCGSVLPASASSASVRRARKAVASSRALAVRSSHRTAERSTGAVRAGWRVTHPSTHASTSPGGPDLPVTRQLPPGEAPAPTRPHYPRRMPGMPPRTSPTRFAYLGPEGTFAEAALSRAVASSEGARVPLPSVPAALAAVRSGDADVALVPLENSVEGSVPATMDGLADGDPLVIIREVFLDVAFVVAARPGTALADVRSVVSHPQALAQTAGRLAQLFPGLTPLPVASTAGAAAAVAAGEYDAAVCAPIAASRY